MSKKSRFLQEPVVHIDPSSFDSRATLKAMSDTAFQARNLARASEILQKMSADKECATILCIAGSMISAGQQKVIQSLVEHNLVDAIVSTGANIVDQDFFEALGFRHYKGSPFVNDHELRELAIDRIYDTYIDEDELRICDQTMADIINEMKPGAYSSREVIQQMGAYLARHNKGANSIVATCYRKQVPIFVPAFSDCSAGFGFVLHQFKRPAAEHVTLDSAKDFLELTKIKLAAQETGLFMVGGGVPKNFAQDTVVAADLLGKESPMHKYAVQITVADERDGALSGSTLKEACSWGKVDTVYEQMVFCEASIALPLLVSALIHEGSWKQRPARKFSEHLEGK